MISTKLARQILPQRQIKDENGQAGFSLAEVMFVLVIAAILFGIVIVAFQTLSRNGRNQARANDRTLIQQTMSRHYGQQNKWPTAAELAASIPVDELNLVGIGSGTTPTTTVTAFGTAPFPTATADNTIYIATGVVATAANQASFTTAGGFNNTVVIHTGVECPATLPTGTAKLIPVASERNTMAMFYVEEGSTLVQCQDNKL